METINNLTVAQALIIVTCVLILALSFVHHLVSDRLQRIEEDLRDIIKEQAQIKAALDEIPTFPWHRELAEQKAGQRPGA